MKIGFVCTANSCRSQMAEGFARALGGGDLEVFSAGTAPAVTVNAGAVRAMQEIGIDISGQRPKALEELPPLDLLVTMGCADTCPRHPARRVLAWQIPDPAGGTPEQFRQTREQIRRQVLEVLAEAGREPGPRRTPEEVFRTLGDETRIRILLLLRDGPLFVCQITGILAVSQAKVSRHLTRLRAAGFVTAVREEQFVRYSLDPENALLRGLLEVYACHAQQESPYAEDRKRAARKEEYLCQCRARGG